MPDPQRPAILSRDHWVMHPQGRIFVRSWTPDATNASVSGSPVVLFHDSLGCVELWRDFPAALCAATGRQVVAYDRLGFGRSGPRAELPALDFIADEARAGFPMVCEQLGIRHFIAFGHSVGGGMAVHCAAAFGAACEALITESAQAFTENQTLRAVTEAKEQFRDEGQLRRLERYHGGKARWVLDAWTERWLHPDFTGWSLREVLPRVRCPVLAIHGASDEYGSTYHAEMIGRLCAGPSRVEILADTFHVPHRERPRAVLDLVADFIAPEQ